MPETGPLVSVIVPSLDGSRGGNVEKLRQSVLRQTIRETEFLVVVGVRPNGRARNVGVRRARGEFVLFIDDDVQLGREDLIEKMLRAFEQDPKIGLVGVSQQVPSDASPFARKCVQRLERFEAPVLDRIEDTDFASHACMMMRRSVYSEVGGEHDLLPRGTDPDLRLRLRKAGYRVVLAPGAWVYHPPPATWRQLWRTFFRNGAGSAFVHRHFPRYCIDTAPSHGSSETGLRSLPVRALEYAGRVARSFFPPRPVVIAARLAYGCGVLKTFLFDKQQWSMALRRDYKYLLLPFGWLRVQLLRLLGRWPKGAVRILLYHRVEDIRRYPLVVTPERFRRQMKFLKAYAPCIPLDQVPALLESEERSLEGDRFVITFDDGYRDNYTNAYNVLTELGTPATIYLVTDFIGKETEFPWVKKLGPPTYQILGWEQVQEMAESGISFGCHTASHPSLATLPLERQQEEIAKSANELKSHIVETPIHFCYPFGSLADFNVDTLKILREKGFRTATTAVAGCNPPGSSLYLLRRTAIDPSDDFFLFRCHLKGYLDILAWKDGPTIGRLKRWLRRTIGL